jgi:hypothetical protein
MTTQHTFDMDGYELFAGDYVTCHQRLYKITKITGDVLELMHVKSTNIAKRKGHEVERLN